jgi:hypothetical protein
MDKELKTLPIVRAIVEVVLGAEAATPPDGMRVASPISTTWVLGLAIAETRPPPRETRRAKRLAGTCKLPDVDPMSKPTKSATVNQGNR